MLYGGVTFGGGPISDGPWAIFLNPFNVLGQVTSHLRPPALHSYVPFIRLSFNKTALHIND